jgi:hypothetical protein
MPGTKKDWDELYKCFHKRIPKHEDPAIVLPILIIVIVFFVAEGCGGM